MMLAWRRWAPTSARPPITSTSSILGAVLTSIPRRIDAIRIFDRLARRFHDIDQPFRTFNQAGVRREQGCA
jgi:hypothetical protein